MRRKVHRPYEKFKLALAGMGKTYEDVGNVIDKSTGAVQNKINGVSDFYITEQMKICKEFSLPTDIFFEDDVA